VSNQDARQAVSQLFDAREEINRLRGLIVQAEAHWKEEHTKLLAAQREIDRLKREIAREH